MNMHTNMSMSMNMFMFMSMGMYYVVAWRCSGPNRRPAVGARADSTAAPTPRADSQRARVDSQPAQNRLYRADSLSVACARAGKHRLAATPCRMWPCV